MMYFFAWRIDIHDVPVACRRHRIIHHPYVNNDRLIHRHRFFQCRLKVFRFFNADALDAVRSGDCGKVRRIGLAVFLKQRRKGRVVMRFFQAGNQLIDDPDISPGGCLLNAGASEIDASVETRWKRILEPLGATAHEWQNP